MPNYSFLERKIASFLRNFPWIKSVLKRSYQIINFILYKKKYSYHTPLQIVCYEYDHDETFFGYYDKSPENITGEYVIFHASKWPTNQLPHANLPIKIILQNLQTNDFFAFETSAYNWQQGSKLQWIDKYRFIFNDFDPKHLNFVSKIVDAQSAQIAKVLPFPIYDTYKETALSLNFSRLNLLRPDYGYRNIKLTNSQLNDDADGVFIGNMVSGEFELLYSLNMLKKIDYHPNMQKSLHKVNHIMFSPSGNKFIFLHRYLYKGRRYDRLMLGYIDGKTPKLLNRYSMVSHCFWIDDNTIVTFMEDSEGDNYYTVDCNTGNIKPLKLPTNFAAGDGHPHIFDNKLIFDTYPDKARMKLLYLLNLDTTQLSLLGEFFEPLQYHLQTRCDLHPRWNYLGNRIYIDSTHTGKRHLYALSYE
ncbi:MAG: hypothetical protein N2662_04980 [Bacteroidales bacterium]|nr:hypothetical protein [Bacteroidales bacterium]